MPPFSRLTILASLCSILANSVFAQASAQPIPATGAPGAPAATQEPATPPAATAPGAISEKGQADLLNALEALETQLGAAKAKGSAAALAAFQAAATSDDKAYTLFMDCKKKIDFDDKGKTGGEWGEWKRRDDVKALHDPEFTTVLKLQLQWLILSIQAGNATTETAYGNVVAQVPAFLDNLFLSYKRMKTFRGELNRDVIETLFGKFYKLDITMGRREGWSYNPINVDAIYDVVVLPYLRAQKNANNVATTWKKRIQMHLDMLEIEEREAKANPSSNAEERAIKFKEEKLPRLEWAMMKDGFLLGNETGSATQMLTHIRNHLAHKDATLWIEELSKLAKHEDVEPSSIADNPSGNGNRAGRQNTPPRAR